MANIADNHTTTPVQLEGNETYLLVAHRMCEDYIGHDLNVALLTATYTVTQATEPLQAIENYPIIRVMSAENSHGNAYKWTNSDKYIWYVDQLSWGNVMTIKYVGGLLPQINDAIYRLANVLETRPNMAPELTDFDFGLDVKQSNMSRVAIPNDIKSMLFPYKQVRF